MKVSFNRRAEVMAVALFLSAARSAAAAEPTMNETAKFIGSHFPAGERWLMGSSLSNDTTIFEYSFVSLKSCELTFTETVIRSDGRMDASSNKVTLREVPPARVKVRDASDTFRGTTYHWLNAGGCQLVGLGARLFILDCEEAARLVKALQHAIRLCGGVDEPF